MSFGALRPTYRRDPAHPAATAGGGPVELAVTPDHGLDAAAFPCPSCGRTLARGVRRCDGCGQRLVMDVPLGRAARLAGSGAAAGVLVTVLLVNLFAPPVPAAVTTPDAAAGAGTGTGAAAAVEIPTAVAAALRGTTAINGRLAAEAEPIAAALAAKSFKPRTVVKILRRMSIDTRAGAGMVRTFAGWPEAAGQQAALAAFYEDLGAQIDTGLATSVKSVDAHRTTAEAILATLARIPAIDADARTLAARGGLDLAPVRFPEALE